MGILNNNYRRKNRRRNRSKSSSMYHEKYPRLVVYRSNRHFEGQIINDFESNIMSIILTVRCWVSETHKE